MKLKIFGLRVDKSPNANTYPRVGTISAKIIECLEAEPATANEIGHYIDRTDQQARALMKHLMDKGIARHKGEFQYELIDAEQAAKVYGDDF